MVFQAPSKLMTIDEFVAFTRLPENAARNFEFVDGEIIEKMPGTTQNSAIAANLVFEARLHCQNHNLPCYISVEAGAYRIGNNTLVPDFAYKPTPMTSEYPDPVPPLWAVEVISFTDKVGDIRKKRQRYLEAGILLWEVYPDDHQIEVYVPNQPVKTYMGQDVIDVPVVAGLQIDVAKPFR